MLTKHALNDPRGDNSCLEEQKIIFNPRWFKSIDIQKKWDSEFKKRHIIVGQDFEKSFPKRKHKLNASTDECTWLDERPTSS